MGPLKCLKTNKIWSADMLKKKKKLIIPDVMVHVPLNPCKLLWIQNPKLVLKPSVLKRSLKVTSTTLKFNSATPIALLLKLKNKLKYFKLKLKMVFKNSMKLNAAPK